MRIGLVAGAVVSLVLVAAGGAVRADEKVELKDVPKVGIDAVKDKFPAGELTGAEKETKAGKTTYEVSLKNKGKNIDVALTSEGKIKEIETEVAVADLPKPVASAIEAKYPKATVKKAEEIVEFKGEDETKNYEVVLTMEDKKTLEVVLSPEGKILEKEEDDD